jgi:toxin YoeB
MEQFRVIVSEAAKADIAKHKKSGNKGSIAKIEKILQELSDHPYIGTGQPEQLKYNLAGLWSRRINQKDRLIYEVNENIVTVFVVSAIGHYFDK